MGRETELELENGILHAKVAELEAKCEGLRLAVGDYHIQRGAPSWKPQCQIDLEAARDAVRDLRMVLKECIREMEEVIYDNSVYEGCLRPVIDQAKACVGD